VEDEFADAEPLVKRRSERDPVGAGTL